MLSLLLEDRQRPRVLAVVCALGEGRTDHDLALEVEDGRAEPLQGRIPLDDLAIAQTC